MSIDSDPSDARRGFSELPDTGKVSKQIEQLLSDAREAQTGGRGRLAVHLYCAAFEMAVEQAGKPTGATIDGLRKAWLLACEQGDRQSAETIFNDLLPYNTQIQTQDAILKLQDLALEQLEELGVDKDDITEIAAQLSALPKDHPEKPQIVSIAALHAKSDQSPSASKQRRTERLNYSNLIGFGSTLDKMREFGLATSDDQKFHEFLVQAQAYHGISGPVLSESFLFYGSSREDTALFALATAGEIGYPVVTIEVEIDIVGNGIIKATGPMRRPMFGPPRLGDLPGRCTLLIQNIDLLQELFRNEELVLGSEPCGYTKQHAVQSSSRMPGSHGRSVQADLLSYLDAMINHSEVFIIATADSSIEQDPLLLGERLSDLLEPLRELEVTAPREIERYEVLAALTKDHLSLEALNLRRAAELTEGLSRYDIMAVAEAVVEDAFRESLRTSSHQVVTWSTFLRELLPYLEPQTKVYQIVEDAIVEQFQMELPDSLGD